MQGTRGISRWQRGSALLTAAVAWGTAPAPALTQSELTIPDKIACTNCEIVLTPVATLGKLQDDVSLSHTSLFAVDPQNRHIYAALTYVPGVLARYDWDGNLVGTFGRPGSGPGEFGSSPFNFSIVTDREGNVHVLESGRRSIVAPGLDSLVRTHQVPFSFDFATALDGGRLLLSASVLRRTSGRDRFILVDSVGTVIERIGTMPATEDVIGVAPRVGGGFWAPYLHQYRIEQYGSGGNLERVIRRDAKWFPAGGTSGRPFSQPTFARVWEESPDRLWIVIKVPDSDQSRARASIGESYRLDQLDWNAVQDSRIEVIDPISGQLLASRRFEQVLVLLNNGYVVQRQETPEGLVQATVSSISLVRREEEP